MRDFREFLRLARLLRAFFETMRVSRLLRDFLETFRKFLKDFLRDFLKDFHETFEKLFETAKTWDSWGFRDLPDFWETFVTLSIDFRIPLLIRYLNRDLYDFWETVRPSRLLRDFREPLEGLFRDYTSFETFEKLPRDFQHQFRIFGVFCFCFVL